MSAVCVPIWQRSISGGNARRSCQLSPGKGTVSDLVSFLAVSPSQILPGTGVDGISVGRDGHTGRRRTAAACRFGMSGSGTAGGVHTSCDGRITARHSHTFKKVHSGTSLPISYPIPTHADATPQGHLGRCIGEFPHYEWVYIVPCIFRVRRAKDCVFFRKAIKEHTEHPLKFHSSIEERKVQGICGK